MNANTRRAARLAAILGFVLGYLFGGVTAPAYASEPVDCSEEVAEVTAYFQGVVSNYQAQLDQVEAERDDWHAAHDRVAANAVARNYEFAQLRADYDARGFELDRWKYRAQHRAAIIHELRAQLRAARR